MPKASVYYYRIGKVFPHDGRYTFPERYWLIELAPIPVMLETAALFSPFSSMIFFNLSLNIFTSSFLVCIGKFLHHVHVGQLCIAAPICVRVIGIVFRPLPIITIVKGQCVGMFAGSGVGKSTLLGMIVKI